MIEQVILRSRELWEAESLCAESVLTAVGEAQGIQSGLIKAGTCRPTQSIFGFFDLLRMAFRNLAGS
jgi:hypothetical protein